jgi:hypothetical protein
VITIIFFTVIPIIHFIAVKLFTVTWIQNHPVNQIGEIFRIRDIKFMTMVPPGMSLGNFLTPRSSVVNAI